MAEDSGSKDTIALRRQIGYVIQEFGLMPHWTVEQNVCLVPRLLGWPPEKQEARSRQNFSIRSASASTKSAIASRLNFRAVSASESQLRAR